MKNIAQKPEDLSRVLNFDRTMIVLPEQTEILWPNGAALAARSSAC